MKKIRVAILMRGSTNKQTSEGKIKKQAKGGKKSARAISIEDDLPVQKNALMKFIDSQPEKHKGGEWEFTGLEFVEAGVSAFHTPNAKRKGLQDAYQSAKNDEFDVLLLFKLDRFGRRSVESLDFALKFLKVCRIWVVDKAKEFTNNGDADEIMNFVEFWSAKKASQDTKVRVEEAMKQIHEEGYWTGGNAPYGFDNHPELSGMLVQIPEEAEVVKMIYDLYVNHGHGYLKISAILNEKEIPSKKGGKWSSHTISKILKNTIYKGFLSYGKTKVVEGEFGSYQKTLKEGGHVSDRYWKEYDLVGADLWDKAQSMKASKMKPNMFGGKTARNTGKGLLVGVLKCQCGGHMTYSNASDWADSKRTMKKEPYGIYRCMTRLKQGVKACGADKATYRTEQLESEVLNAIFEYTKQLIENKELEKIKEKTASATIQIKDQIEEVKADIARFTEAQQKAEKSLTAILMGELEGSHELFSKVYDQTSAKLKELEKRKAELDALKNTDDLNEIDMIKLEEFILSWKEIFKFGTQGQKRTLIQSLVNEIQVTKEKTVIKFGFNIPQFVEVIASIKETASALENTELVSGDSYLYFMNGGSSNGEQSTGIEYLNTMNDRNSNSTQYKGMIKKLSKVFSKPITKKLVI